MCGCGLSLLLSPAQYAATAKIQVMVDPGDDSYDSYNPYFIQTTFELIQSQMVLTNVVDTLNLNEVWGKEYYGGATLKTSKALKILTSRLRLAPVQNTKFVSITFYSEDPDEAAQVANAIAAAYRAYRVNQQKVMATKGMAVLQQSFQDEEKQLSILQTNVEHLRQKFGMQNTAPTNSWPEQAPYWNEKVKLDQLINFHELLDAKIHQCQHDLEIPVAPVVQIVDRAKPPKVPCGPNRVLGLALMIIGLFPAAGGFLLLKFTPRRFN